MLIKVHEIALKDSLQLLTTKDLKVHGRPVIPSVFYVWGFHDELHLEEHHTSPGYDFSKWDPWMVENRIYITKSDII